MPFAAANVADVFRDRSCQLGVGSFQLQQAVPGNVTFLGQVAHAVELLFQKLELYVLAVTGFFESLVLQHQAGNVFIKRGKLALDGRLSGAE